MTRDLDEVRILSEAATLQQIVQIAVVGAAVRVGLNLRDGEAVDPTAALGSAVHEVKGQIVDVETNGRRVRADDAFTAGAVAREVVHALLTVRLVHAADGVGDVGAAWVRHVPALHLSLN